MSNFDFRVEKVADGYWRLWITCEKDSDYLKPFDAFGDPLFESEAEAHRAGLEWANLASMDIQDHRTLNHPR